MLSVWPPKVGWQFTLAVAASNLVWLPKLLVVAAGRPEFIQGVPPGPKNH
jgi:hypothetical protein